MKRSFFSNINYNYDFGIFIERPNRFIAYVKFEDGILRCHVPDPGRLKEVLIKDRKILLRFSPTQVTQKTDASVIGVFETINKIWVSLDSQLANRFIKHSWKNLPLFEEYNDLKSEYSFGKSRLDFLLSKKNSKNSKCLVEVKTATFVQNGIGLFPDAPTKRGTKHVQDLIQGKKQGYDSLIVFVVPRADIKFLKPNKKLDPNFYNVIKEALSIEVKILVLRCDFTPQGLLYKDEIPFKLD